MTTNKQMVPELRFKGFTDAWEQRKLGAITDSFSGGTPTAGKAEYYGGEIPFIRPGEISSDSTELFITDAGLNNSSAKMVGIGDILYALYGATSGETSISRINGAINQAILAIRPTKGDDPYMIVQWLKKQKETIISTYLQGGQGNLSGSIVKDLLITLPKNKDEQAKVGSFFKQLDQTITLHQRKLEKLQELKKGYLQKLFPKNGSKFPQLRFAGFTDAWEKRPIKKIATVNGGKDYKHLNKGDIPVYGTGGYMLSVDQALSEENGIGIGRKGTINSPYILRAPYWTVDTLFYVIPKGTQDLNFLYAIFQRVNWKKYDESTGVPSLSKQTINAVEVTTPTQAEQELIGTMFKQLDNLIAVNQRKVELLKKLKQAYLQKMFV